MARPWVAIVTPVYNGAKFLAETMECVQSQTYPNIVHFVLDNASTDSTPDIIARFANRRIAVVTQRNSRTLPLIDNWNAAMRLVPREASYFRLLPADDLMVPHAVEKMVTLGEKKPAVTIISCQEWMGPFLLGADVPSDRTVFNGRSLVRGSLLNAVGFPHLHCLYRYPPGGIPDTFYTPDFYGVRLLATDVDAAMRTLVEGTCAYVHEPLVATRWHAGSVTSTDMIPNFIKLWSDLQLIDRWGPKAFDSRAEYLKCRNKHLRFYYRHLVLWWAQGKRQLLNQHREWLGRAAAMPSTLDYVEAITEWPVLRAARLLARLRLVKPRYQIA
jgi:glycosyltransferase involved in cell wall biosynthesis